MEPPLLPSPSVPPPPPDPPTSATVANPTPAALSFNDPPYAEMIYAAISALKERDGSSKRAIAKYIETAYTNLPPTHSALLTQHLKRLKNTGFLVMVKKSYKLPPRSDSDPAPILPSNDVVINNNCINSTTAASKVSAVRGRGRPRKSVPVPGTGSVVGLDKPKRGRGRPRKTDGPVQRGPIKRKQNLPRKLKTVKGRQVQQQAQAQQDQLNNVDISYVTSSASLQMPVPIPVPGGARPRGRPKKVGIVADTSGKRLARPPKKLQSSSGTGRPVGRPKKNLASAITEAAQVQAQAITDLKRKLEFFQSKVKQVVTEVKSQITSESQMSIVAAVHELEALASMDINIPLKDDTQAQVLQSS